jgi:hypothetical protein
MLFRDRARGHDREDADPPTRLARCTVPTRPVAPKVTARAHPDESAPTDTVPLAFPIHRPMWLTPHARPDRTDESGSDLDTWSHRVTCSSRPGPCQSSRPASYTPSSSSASNGNRASGTVATTRPQGCRSAPEPAPHGESSLVRRQTPFSRSVTTSCLLMSSTLLMSSRGFCSKSCLRSAWSASPKSSEQRLTCMFLGGPKGTFLEPRSTGDGFEGGTTSGRGSRLKRTNKSVQRLRHNANGGDSSTASARRSSRRCSTTATQERPSGDWLSATASA